MHLSCQAMYDHDVIEEEVLLDWGKKISKKYVSKETAAEIHAKAQPFLKWLQEAEEEETTEEEEEDGDVEVSVGQRCSKPVHLLNEEVISFCLSFGVTILTQLCLVWQMALLMLNVLPLTKLYKAVVPNFLVWIPYEESHDQGPI